MELPYSKAVELENGGRELLPSCCHCRKRAAGYLIGPWSRPLAEKYPVDQC